MTCQACGASIPEARLKAMPTTVWCVQCADSRVERVGGNMIWWHKTAPELQIKASLTESKDFHRRYDRRRAAAQLPMDTKRSR